MRTSVAYETRTVASVMHRGVVRCRPETPLTNVARLMAGHRIHSVVVWTDPHETDEDGTLWGIVSDQDLARVIAAGASGLPASAVTRAPAATIAPNESITRAAELMVACGEGHLVVARRGRPVGVISTLDLAGALADSADR